MAGPSYKTKRNTATGLQAAGAIFGGLGAASQAKTEMQAISRSVNESLFKSKEIVRRAELRKKGFRVDSKSAKGTAQAAAAGSGFALDPMTSGQINTDFDTQLAQDIAALDAETQYELQLEAMQRAELQAAADQARKAKKGAMFGSILGVGGAVAGGLYGGPGGAAAGATAGSAAGNYFGSR